MQCSLLSHMRLAVKQKPVCSEYFLEVSVHVSRNVVRQYWTKISLSFPHCSRHLIPLLGTKNKRPQPSVYPLIMSSSYHFLFLVIMFFSLRIVFQKAGHLLGIFSVDPSQFCFSEWRHHFRSLLGFLGLWMETQTGPETQTQSNSWRRIPYWNPFSTNYNGQDETSWI